MIDIFNADKMYITSDLHLFHRNIINYCNRNYDTSDEDCIYKMNEDILKLFDALPDDKNTVVWNLVDLAFGRDISKDENYFSVLSSIVERMKGKNRTLVLLLGNHDKDLFKFTKAKKSYKSVVEFFEKMGFDIVYNAPIVFNENIILSHKPIYLNPYGNEFVNIHGHTHNVYVDENFFKEKSEEYEKALKKAKKDDDKIFLKELESWPVKKVNADSYINVCLDTKNKIYDFKKIINNYFRSY